MQDATGCTVSGSVNIESDPLTITGCPSDITILTNTSGCQAIVNWSLPIVNCSGATFTSDYNPGDVFGIGTTTVTYTASNTIGETVTCSFDVTVYNDLVASVTATSNASCFDAADGTAALTITGGVAPYSFDWSHDGTGDFDDAQNPDDLTRGTHNYVVQDATGCTVSGSVNVESDPLEITGCPADMTMVANMAGCQALVSWIAPATNCTLTSTHEPGNLFSLGTTEVTYTASNAAGEQLTCTFQVTVIQDLTVDVTISNETCAGSSDGQVMLTITGSNAPYAIDWDVDGSGDFDDSDVLRDQTYGTYSYMVQDRFGCTVSGTADISYEPIVVSNCPDDIVLQADSEGCKALATWSAPTANCQHVSVISSHESGTYFPVGSTEVIYTFMDVAGNSEQCRFMIQVDSDLGIRLAASTEPSCFGYADGAMGVEGTGGTGGYLYKIDEAGRSEFNVNNTISNIGAGLYHWQVSDGIGCMADSSLVLSEPDSIAIQASIMDFDAGKLIDLTVSGGTAPYDFAWSGRGIVDQVNDEDIYVLANGTFNVTVADSNGCTDSANVTVEDLSEFCSTLDFDIYPNPSSGEFTVRFVQCATPVLITIYDTAGKNLLSVSSLDLASNIQHVQFSSGTYIVQVRQGDKAKSKLLMIR